VECGNQLLNLGLAEETLSLTLGLWQLDSCNRRLCNQLRRCSRSQDASENRIGRANVASLVTRGHPVHPLLHVPDSDASYGDPAETVGGIAYDMEAQDAFVLRPLLSRACADSRTTLLPTPKKASGHLAD